MARNIYVVPYQPEWPTLFKKEQDALTQALTTNNLVQIIHIGSTSVPNLTAKPIIDMLLVVKDIEALDKENTVFTNLGYLPHGEFGIPKRRYYAKGGDNRTHQIHAFQMDNLYEIGRHVMVRDYLRNNKDALRRYADIKTKGAALYPHDIEGYCDFKDAFVKQLEKNAIEWHWKQH
ncbi:MAG: GrpB family protein [Vagococcus sp.]|uniref:GrpB family protein n=1 Tax=Vagococcus sp. TaxID=1933889 RepID=UPI002FCA9605